MGAGTSVVKIDYQCQLLRGVRQEGEIFPKLFALHWKTILGSWTLVDLASVLTVSISPTYIMAETMKDLSKVLEGLRSVFKVK